MGYFLRTIVSMAVPMARGMKASEAPRMTSPTRIFNGAVTTIVLICGCMRAMNPTLNSIRNVAIKTGSAIFQPMMKICREASIRVPNHWLVYYAVDDADVSVAKVQELGGTLVVGPMDIEPGRFAVVTDPQGATFAVIRMAG